MSLDRIESNEATAHLWKTIRVISANEMAHVTICDYTIQRGIVNKRVCAGQWAMG